MFPQYTYYRYQKDEPWRFDCSVWNEEEKKGIEEELQQDENVVEYTFSTAPFKKEVDNG